MLEKTIWMLKVDAHSLPSELDKAGYRKMGVVVKMAFSYKDIDAILNQGNISIVLINLDMEDLDVFAVIKNIRENPEYSSIPIMTTSVDGKISVKKGRRYFTVENRIVKTKIPQEEIELRRMHS